MTLAAAMPVSAAPASDLRGYGTVQAEFTDHGAAFTCQDAAHADILLGKLLADLFWDAHGAAVPGQVRRGSKSIPVHLWPPYGVMAAARVGRRVIVVGASDRASLAKRISSDSPLLSPEARFEPARDYPRYLDFYDLRAFKVYTAAMTSLHGFGLDSHWDFIHEFGLGGTSFQQLNFVFGCPAPGVVEWSPADYEVAAAEAGNGIVVPGIGAAGPLPFWTRDRFPDGIAAAAPSVLLGAWGGYGTAGAAFQSFGMTQSEQNESDLRFLADAMRRYRASPALGGWALYGGEPGDEMGLHDRTSEYWDYSPAGQEAFRKWLREDQGYTLAALGARWQGDPRAFKTWDDVTLPDPNSFFGDLGNGTDSLPQDWERHPAASETDAPPPGSDGWLPVALPPSQQQDFLPGGPAFYRTQFDASAWLAHAGNRDVYLVCGLNSIPREATGVWLNGQSLGDFQSKKGAENPFALKVTGLVKPGVNTIALKIMADGAESRIYGPVFLTTAAPRYYPYLGREENARYVDLKEWQSCANAAMSESVFALGRALDPERPFLLSCSDIDNMADYTAELASRYTMGVEFTGREAWYYPWWSGLGLVDGFYGTSEASGTAHGDYLDRMLNWSVYDGDGSHSLFYDVEDYIKEERDTGWFTKNKRVIQLLGKSLRARPAIALLRSARTTRFGDVTPQMWDIGRGELQSLHYDNVYVTEREVENGLVDAYPVLFDTGTVYMDAKLIAALRRYVENGGTFIALHMTGRHGILDPDTYPVSRLTGYRVTGTARTGDIQFASAPPVMKAFAGRKLGGAGSAVDYRNADSAAGAGEALEPIDPNAVALAAWDDGSVAVGYRKVGKGRVITLGSTFWRGGKDVSGAWRAQGTVESEALGSLFADLGVSRVSDCASPAIWTRRFTTKNGLQDWLVAFDSEGTPVTSDVSFQAPRPPDRVWDMVAQTPVPFRYSQGWVHLDGVTVAGNGLRIFGVKRADLADGIPFWWAEKERYWRKTAGPADPPAPPTVTPEDGAISCETWRFHADRDGTAQSPEWRSLAYDTRSWQTIPSGPWAIHAAALKGYRGKGLYRHAFTLPAAWAGRRVLLNLYSANNAIVYDHGSFYVNGHLAAHYDGHGGTQMLSYDVTPFLVPGQNVLAVEVDGGDALSGLSGAVWLSPQGNLAPSEDLGGPWKLVGADGSSSQEVSIGTGADSAEVVGKSLVKTVTIPDAWRQKRIVLRLATTDSWLTCVVVNGHPITFDVYAHPFGNMADLDITRYLNRTGENTIELWPGATVPNQSGSAQAQTAKMTVAQVVVGCADAVR